MNLWLALVIPGRLEVIAIPKTSLQGTDKTTFEGGIPIIGEGVRTEPNLIKL